MAVDVVAAAVLLVFCSSPIRREALASAWNTAVERVNLVPRTCEVVVLLLLAMVVVAVEVVTRFLLDKIVYPYIRVRRGRRRQHRRGISSNASC